MADEIKLKAPTVEQQVVVNINGEEKLRSFADTLEKISNNKNLQKYWKTQQELINVTADAYGNFSKKASQDNAKELVKVTNALKAMAGTDLSNILPDFDKISKAMAEAQKVAGNIDSAFSVKGFKEAFDSFETLKAYGVDIQNLFSHFGVSSDVGELQKNVRSLEGEVEKLTRRLTNAKNANEELRNEFDNFKSGSGFADKLDELDNLKSEMSYLREQAEETFRQFLKLNNITEDGYDRDGFYDDNRFKEYFQNIQSGYMSASDAIRQFKTEYSYLLEDSFKSNNDTFGLEQLQSFSNKLDSIFRQVEETSTKINDIISNGVITKSVENLSMDSSLSDSQRSLFGNLLQDEESLKSITALFQKLIEESNKTSKVDLFNDEQLQQVLSIFDKMEGHLSSLRSIISDVGDGGEFSPLLSTIDKINTSIKELSTSVKGIGLNMNIDVGSDDELDRKLQTKVANALQAYQKLFNNIKMSSAGGSFINQEFFDFNLDNYDTAYQKLKAIVNFIKKQRTEAKKQFNGYDALYEDSDKSLWKSAQAYLAQVTKAETEIKKVNSGESNPLENLFGNTKDLSEVIEQLNKVVEKLNEISSSATEFKNIFKEGFNVTTSVEEIDKLTNRVKELEDELAKIKLNPASVDKSNISSENIIGSQSKENTQALNDETNSVNSLISAFRKLYETNKKSYKGGESLLVGNFDGSTLSHMGADFSSIETDVIDGTIKAFKDTTNQVVSFLAHTHPGDVAAFSAGDIYNAFFDYINNQIKNYFIIAKKEISWFDTSSLDGIDHEEFLEKFKDNKERIVQDIQEETQVWSNFSKYLTNIFNGDLYGGLTKLVKDSIDNSIANLGEHKIPEDVLNSLYIGLEEKVRKYIDSINDNDFVSASTVMNTLRRDIGSGLEEYAMSKPPFANGGASTLDSTMWKNLYDELKSVFDTANQQNENIQNGIKQALIETLSSYGINADDVYKSMSFDNFSKAIVDGNLSATQSAREAIEVFKQEAQAVENIGSETQIKDVSSNISSENLNSGNVDNVTNSLIEEQKAVGELDMVFRGLEGSLNGFMSNSGRLATFFTTSPLLARQYADSLGGVYQAMVALGKSLDINAEGRDWNVVEYLGDGSDEVSRKIIELRKQIDNLYEQLNASGASGTGLDGRVEENRGDFSRMVQLYGDAGVEYSSYIEAVEKGNIIENQENQTVKQLMIQLYELEKAYRTISDAKDNVYGTHTTDEFAELAKVNGYDSVMFRNIKDSFDRTKNLTDVGVIFDESQVASVKNVSNIIDDLVQKIDGIKTQHGLNLPINIELPKEISRLSDGNFINNLTGEIYDDVQKAIESLKELDLQIDNISPMKDVFQGDDKVNTDASTTAIKEESQALEQVSTSAKDAATSKEKFANANKEVKASAESSSTSLDEEKKKIENVGDSAEEIKKKLDDVVFKPNTEGFDEIVSKLDIAKDKIEEISKITKSSVWSESQGEYLESYNIKYKNGTSEIRGESSNKKGSNVLRANEVAYDAKSAEQEAKALNQAWEEANKVNNALNETKKTLSSLPRMTELDTQFLSLDTKLSSLNSELTSGKISVADYKKEVKSLTSEYSKLVTIQQNRDVETYKQNAKAAEQEAKQFQKLAEEKRKLRQQEKQSTQSSVDKALKDQVSAWEQIQSIREKIAKTNNTDEIAVLQESKKHYQEQYNNANKILKTNDELYDKEAQIARLEQVRLETNAKLASYKTKQVESLESTIKGYYKDYDNRNTKPTGKNRSVEYQQALDEYLVSIKELEVEKNRLSQLPFVSEKELSKFRELEQIVQENAKALKSMSAAQKGSDEDSRTKEIDKLTKYLDKNTRISKEAREQLEGYLALLKSGDPSVNVKEIHTAWTKVAVSEREAGREGKSFFDIFNNKVTHRLASQLAMYYLSFYDFIRYARNAITAVKELDTALIDLKKTTTMSSSELERFYYDSNEVAKRMGVTTSEIINQASAWSRLGYSTKDASTKMAELSSQFASISPGMSTDDAQEGLVSIMKAWDISTDQVEREVMDNINVLGNKFAETNQDIVEGMKRSASTFAALGQTWTDSFAIFTGAQEVIQNAETVGTALKTLSLRIRGYSEDTEELDSELANITGEVIDLTKTANNPQGISLFTDASQEHYKSMVDYLREISNIWDEIDEKSKTQLLEKLFGKRGASVGSAIIGNFDAVEKALTEMEGAAGAADAEMGIIQESIDYKLNALKETWVGTAQAMIDRGDFGTIIDALTKLSEVIGWVVDKADLLGTIGIGAGIFAGFKNIGRPKMFGLYKHADINMCSLGY